MKLGRAVRLLTALTTTCQLISLSLLPQEAWAQAAVTPVTKVSAEDLAANQQALWKAYQAAEDPARRILALKGQAFVLWQKVLKGEVALAQGLEQEKELRAKFYAEFSQGLEAEIPVSLLENFGNHFQNTYFSLVKIEQALGFSLQDIQRNLSLEFPWAERNFAVVLWVIQSYFPENVQNFFKPVLAEDKVVLKPQGNLLQQIAFQNDTWRIQQTTSPSSQERHQAVLAYMKRHLLYRLGEAYIHNVNQQNLTPAQIAQKGQELFGEELWAVLSEVQQEQFARLVQDARMAQLKASLKDILDWAKEKMGNKVDEEEILAAYLWLYSGEDHLADTYLEELETYIFASISRYMVLSLQPIIAEDPENVDAYKESYDRDSERVREALNEQFAKTLPQTSLTKVPAAQDQRKAKAEFLLEIAQKYTDYKNYAQQAAWDKQSFDLPLNWYAWINIYEKDLSKQLKFKDQDVLGYLRRTKNAAELQQMITTLKNEIDDYRKNMAVADKADKDAVKQAKIVAEKVKTLEQDVNKIETTLLPFMQLLENKELKTVGQLVRHLGGTPEERRQRYQRYFESLAQSWIDDYPGLQEIYKTEVNYENYLGMIHGVKQRPVSYMEVLQKLAAAYQEVQDKNDALSEARQEIILQQTQTVARQFFQTVDKNLVAGVQRAKDIKNISDLNKAFTQSGTFLRSFAQDYPAIFELVREWQRDTIQNGEGVLKDTWQFFEQQIIYRGWDVFILWDIGGGALLYLLRLARTRQVANTVLNKYLKANSLEPIVEKMKKVYLPESWRSYFGTVGMAVIGVDLTKQGYDFMWGEPADNYHAKQALAMVALARENNPLHKSDVDEAWEGRITTLKEFGKSIVVLGGFMLVFRGLNRLEKRRVNSSKGVQETSQETRVKQSRTADAAKNKNRALQKYDPTAPATGETEVVAVIRTGDASVKGIAETLVNKLNKLLKTDGQENPFKLDQIEGFQESQAILEKEAQDLADELYTGIKHGKIFIGHEYVAKFLGRYKLDGQRFTAALNNKELPYLASANEQAAFVQQMEKAEKAMLAKYQISLLKHTAKFIENIEKDLHGKSLVKGTDGDLAGKVNEAIETAQRTLHDNYETILQNLGKEDVYFQEFAKKSKAIFYDTTPEGWWPLLKERVKNRGDFIGHLKFGKQTAAKLRNAFLTRTTMVQQARLGQQYNANLLEDLAMTEEISAENVLMAWLNQAKRYAKGEISAWKMSKAQRAAIELLAQESGGTLDLERTLRIINQVYKNSMEAEGKAANLKRVDRDLVLRLQNWLAAKAEGGHPFWQWVGRVQNTKFWQNANMAAQRRNIKKNLDSSDNLMADAMQSFGASLAHAERIGELDASLKIQQGLKQFAKAFTQRYTEVLAADKARVEQAQVNAVINAYRGRHERTYYEISEALKEYQPQDLGKTRLANKEHEAIDLVFDESTKTWVPSSSAAAKGRALEQGTIIDVDAKLEAKIAPLGLAALAAPEQNAPGVAPQSKADSYQKTLAEIDQQIGEMLVAQQNYDYLSSFVKEVEPWSPDRIQELATKIVQELKPFDFNQVVLDLATIYLYGTADGPADEKLKLNIRVLLGAMDIDFDGMSDVKAQQESIAFANRFPIPYVMGTGFMDGIIYGYIPWRIITNFNLLERFGQGVRTVGRWTHLEKAYQRYLYKLYPESLAHTTAKIKDNCVNTLARLVSFTSRLDETATSVDVAHAGNKLLNRGIFFLSVLAGMGARGQAEYERRLNKEKINPRELSRELQKLEQLNLIDDALFVLNELNSLGVELSNVAEDLEDSTDTLRSWAARYNKALGLFGQVKAQQELFQERKKHSYNDVYTLNGDEELRFDPQILPQLIEKLSDEGRKVDLWAAAQQKLTSLESAVINFDQLLDNLMAPMANMVKDDLKTHWQQMETPEQITSWLANVETEVAQWLKFVQAHTYQYGETTLSLGNVPQVVELVQGLERKSYAALTLEEKGRLVALAKMAQALAAANLNFENWKQVQDGWFLFDAQNPEVQDFKQDLDKLGINNYFALFDPEHHVVIPRMGEDDDYNAFLDLLTSFGQANGLGGKLAYLQQQVENDPAAVEARTMFTLKAE